MVLGWSSGAGAVPLFVSDPVPTVSFIGDKPILHKDLDSNFQYSATGVDVLYNSESTTWTFNLVSLGLNPSDYSSVISVSLSMTLDDYYSKPTSSYLGTAAINSSTVLDGLIPADHGSPFGGHFTNWSLLDFTGSIVSDVITVSLSHDTVDDGGTGEWIAIDYVEVALSPIPEPSTALLLGLGLVGMSLRKKGRVF